MNFLETPSVSIKAFGESNENKVGTEKKGTLTKNSIKYIFRVY